MRGATWWHKFSKSIGIISIHAPHAGCDIREDFDAVQVHNFNPRTPCGVRQILGHSKPSTTIFQSTHPMRGATILCNHGSGGGRISIHAPHAGCDIKFCAYRAETMNFNPRTPCGVRQCNLCYMGG